MVVPEDSVCSVVLPLVDCLRRCKQNSLAEWLQGHEDIVRGHQCRWHCAGAFSEQWGLLGRPAVASAGLWQVHGNQEVPGDLQRQHHTKASPERQGGAFWQASGQGHEMQRLRSCASRCRFCSHLFSRIRKKSLADSEMSLQAGRLKLGSSDRIAFLQQMPLQHIRWCRSIPIISLAGACYW